MKNNNVIILHGAYGYPEENWFGWFKNEIERDTVDCYVPAFPTPEGQHLNNWIEIFNTSYHHLIHSNSILIGHSLGAAFVLRWLEQQNCQLSAVILVGAFLNTLGIEKFDRINHSFFRTTFNWQHLKQRSQQFFCYHGDNDPYVPPSHVDFICENLNAIKIIIPQGGHFNTAAGFTTFPQLLLHVKQIQEKNYA